MALKILRVIDHLKDDQDKELEEERFTSDRDQLKFDPGTRFAPAVQESVTEPLSFAPDRELDPTDISQRGFGSRFGSGAMRGFRGNKPQTTSIDRIFDPATGQILQRRNLQDYEGGGVAAFLGETAGTIAIEAPVMVAGGAIGAPLAITRAASAASLKAARTVTSPFGRRLLKSALPRPIAESATGIALEGTRALVEAAQGDTDEALSAAARVPFAFAAPFLPGVLKPKSRKLVEKVIEDPTDAYGPGTTAALTKEAFKKLDREARRKRRGRTKNVGLVESTSVFDEIYPNSTTFVKRSAAGDLLHGPVVGGKLSWQRRAKAYFDTFAEKFINSSISALRKQGKSANELADRLIGMKEWEYAEHGTAINKMLRALDDLNDADMRIFIKMADEGAFAGVGKAGPASKRLAKITDAHDLWKTEVGKLQSHFKQLGATILNADGKEVSFMGGVFDNFFPHYHDWDALLKNPTTAAFIKKIGKRIADRMGMSATTGEDFAQQLAARRSEHATRSLHTRTANIPFWIGDPNTPTGFRGDDARRAIAMFFEDNYREVATRRFLGPKDPSSLDMYGEFGLVNLSTIQKRILDKIKSGELKEGFSEEEATRIIAGKTHEGAKGIANQLMKAIIEEGGDHNLAQQIVDNVTGSAIYDSRIIRASQALRNFNIVTRLSLAVIENSTQSVFTASRFGFKHTREAAIEFAKESVQAKRGVFMDGIGEVSTVTDLLKLTSQTLRTSAQGQGVEYARQSGAVLDDILRLTDYDTTATKLGRSAHKVLRWTGFEAVERMNRVIAANAAKRHVASQAIRLGKQLKPGTRRMILRDFRNLGFRKAEMEKFFTNTGVTDEGANLIAKLELDGTDAVVKQFLAPAGYRGSKATQFISDVMDSPIFFSSPQGRVLFQFKTFAYNATKLIYRDVVKEAALGNLKPLLRLAVAGGIAGEFSQDIKALAVGKNPISRGRDVIAGLDVPFMKTLFGPGEIQSEEHAMQILGHKFSTDQFFRRYIENIIGIGASGLFISAAQSAIIGGRSGLYELVGGPSVATSGRFASELFAILGEGIDVSTGGTFNWEKTHGMARQITSLVPVFGRALQRTYLPTDRQLSDNIIATDTDRITAGLRLIRQDMHSLREQALDLADEGRVREARALLRQWNSSVGKRLKPIRKYNQQSDSKMPLRLGALYRFGLDEMGRIIRGHKDEDAGYLQRIQDLKIDFDTLE